jgi:hypothetical protein
MGGPRCGAAGGGNAPREGVHGVSTTKPGASAAGKAASDGSAAPRSCAARHSSQVWLGNPPSLSTAWPTACAPHRQLREQEYGDEKEIAQRIHGAILPPIAAPSGRRVLQSADSGTAQIVARRSLRRP